MRKVIGLVVCLLPVVASAECIPSPDCAAIGYDETSCDGGSIKCPFDISKLRCIPCDSSFRYKCEGENIVSSIGVACNNKYVVCECVEGAKFVQGECICENNCIAGTFYYSDGTCSSCLVENKTPVGVVVKDNEIIASLEINHQKWAPQKTDIPNIQNYTTEEEALTDFSGFDNTQAFVDYYGTEVDINVYAGVRCYNFAPENFESSKGKWYLPAIGELKNYFGTNYPAIKILRDRIGLNIGNQEYWSSTEKNYDTVWRYNPISDKLSLYGRIYDVGYVMCFLSIKQD